MDFTKKGYMLLLTCVILASKVAAQEHRLLTIDSVLSMTERNSKQLMLSRQEIGISQKNTEIAKQLRLPSADANANFGYISNAHVWDKNFNYEETVSLPHISDAVSVSAAFTVFQGKAISNTIAKASLQEQVAALDYQKNKEDIQFLIVAKYLDLFTYYNQEKVLQDNIDLANQRLRDIKKMVQEGMRTHNDVIRANIQISDFQLEQTQVKNNILIASHDLCTVIGLDKDIIIDVDTTLYGVKDEFSKYAILSDSAKLAQLPELRAADAKIAMARKETDIVKAERSPKISLYAEDGISHPFLYSIPPLDIYMHYFQVGARLTYNIGSLYQSKKRIQKAKLEEQVAVTQRDWVSQQAEMASHAALVKLNEAKVKLATEKENYDLARDNYRIVNQKYENQLAVMTDLLDATTALLSSQMKLANAQVGIIYQWFNLLKASGNWDHAE